MITSNELDEIVEYFDSNPDAIDNLLEELETKQPNLLDILIGSHAEMLSEEELDYVLFLFLVIYYGFKKLKPIGFIEEEDIVNSEEKVWGLINQTKQFDVTLDTLYEQKTQEGLIEFIDVSLSPDEENEFHITDSGRMVMLAVLVTEVEILSKD